MLDAKLVFLNELKISPKSNTKDWTVLEAFEWESKDRTHVAVPVGFVTDFASIPNLVPLCALLIWFSGWSIKLFPQLWIQVIAAVLFTLSWMLILVSDRLRPWGKYGKAAVVHDYLYRAQIYSRKRCDDYLFEGMVDTCTAKWQRGVIYFFLRLGGWVVFNRYKRLHRKVAP